MTSSALLRNSKTVFRFLTNFDNFQAWYLTKLKITRYFLFSTFFPFITVSFKCRLCHVRLPARVNARIKCRLCYCNTGGKYGLVLPPYTDIDYTYIYTLTKHL